MDLAAEAARTALASVMRKAGRADLTELTCGADDDVILTALAGADMAGIDCPLGWPEAFVADHLLCQQIDLRLLVESAGLSRRYTKRRSTPVYREVSRSPRRADIQIHGSAAR